VLGGFGLPHAETHAIILPHVTRFNVAAASDARERLCDALRSDDPAVTLLQLLQSFPIPQRLRDIGLAADKIAVAADQVASLGIRDPRPVSAAEVRDLLTAAY
jgi:alcohol dehydrogenase class IV